MNTPETDAVKARYARRDGAADARRYSLYANAAALQTQQERVRVMAQIWQAHGWDSLANRTLLEVGCGAGGNLQDLLRLGATPACLTGIELMPARVASARASLPGCIRIVEGDASAAAIPANSQDAVLAFTLFSSLLDKTFRRDLAQTMWEWVAPGGGVLVYDFTVDNPRNADVEGIPLSEVATLFPHARLQSRRVTLAPPLARRLPPSWISGASSLFFFLRTHRLTWAMKPR